MKLSNKFMAILIVSIITFGFAVSIILKPADGDEITQGNIDNSSVETYDRDGGTFSDPRDGKVYQTLAIEEMEWMAENLAYEPDSGNYWAYNNDNSNIKTYGYLYDWETACDVCPDGWHLPNDAEWTALTDYIGGRKKETGRLIWNYSRKGNAGGKMKETGTAHWHSPNKGATNESDFSALPGGYRHSYRGSFHSMGDYARFWSSSKDFFSVYYWELDNGHPGVYRENATKGFGFSVRCVRD